MPRDNLAVAANCVDIPGVRLAYDAAGRNLQVAFLHGDLLARPVDAQFVFFAGNYRVTTCGVQARVKTQPFSRTVHPSIFFRP